MNRIYSFIRLELQIPFLQISKTIVHDNRIIVTGADDELMVESKKCEILNCFS